MPQVAIGSPLFAVGITGAGAFPCSILELFKVGAAGFTTIGRGFAGRNAVENASSGLDNSGGNGHAVPPPAGGRQNEFVAAGGGRDPNLSLPRRRSAVRCWAGNHGRPSRNSKPRARRVELQL